MRSQPSPELLRLTALLHLEKRARAATSDELPFVIANETLGVVRYRQALLWRAGAVNRIVAVSGVALHDASAPYIVWASRICRTLQDRQFDTIRELTSADLGGQDAEEWPDWLPARLVWVPLHPGMGALLLAREHPLGDGDRAVLDLLADAYGHAWQAHSKADARSGGLARLLLGRRKALAIAAIAAVLAISLIPVRQSVLAPAEIVPRNPATIRSPLDGVVSAILVKPNDKVWEGQTLLTLDTSRIESQLAVAQRAKDVAEAELQQASQLAVVDQKIRASLPVLQGKLDQQKTEIAYLASQIERATVKAPIAGLAIFDDPNDWIGRPVQIGERVMVLADPNDAEVEARVPTADAIDLDIGGPVWLFLNIDPERPRDAVLSYVAYKAQKGPDGVLAYRTKARLADGEAPPRIGLKGTAKLYGAPAPLVLSVFRRPLSSLRQWLGL